MEYVSLSEARNLLHNVFEKNANPSITEILELAHHVSWEITRVKRYFINKRANSKRKKKFEVMPTNIEESQVPTDNVEEFFKYWEKHMTEAGEDRDISDWLSV